MSLSDRTVAVTLTAKVGGFVDGLTKARGSVDDLAKAGTKVNDTGTAVGNLGTKAALLGGAVALGVGVAIKSFADFDKQMSAAGAATQSTGLDLDALRKAAIDAGNATQFSATDAALAITEMGKAGVSTKDIIGGGLAGALSLAAAGQLSVGSAGQIAATALNQFNLQGRDLPHVADLLAAGAGKALGSVSELGTALNYVGPVAHSMGISIEETTGVLAEFASAGLVGEQGGTAFRGMLSSLLSPSKAAQIAMKDLGINLYDANGKFVGMQATAQILHDKLGGLDEATRNQALGQIFGNAQLAAATVLYTGGASAVADWTAKVNDQGFASRQAAQLMDNLSGDLEKFSSSVETAFIQAGSGGNSALRSIVQGGTDVVNTLGQIPGPVLIAGTALGALALAGPKAFLTFRQYKTDLDAAGLSLDRISEKAPRLGSALSTAATAAKVLGVALVGASVASRALDDNVDPIGLEQLTRNLTGSSNALSILDRTIGVSAGSTGVYTSKVTGLGEALHFAFNPDFTDQADNSLRGLFQVFGGENSADIKVAGDRLKDVDTALAQLVQGGHATDAANAMGQIQNAAYAQGITVDQLKAKFPQYAEALATVTNAAEPAKAATTALATSQEDAAKAADAAAKANDSLLKSLSAYADLVLGARDSARAYEAAVDGADKALKENGKTLDIHTEKGRANQAAIDAIASATLNSVTKTFESRDANTSLADAVGTATKQVEAGRDSFIDHAVKMGMDRGAAETLATQLGLTTENVQKLSNTIVATPDAKKVKIEADTKPANAEVEGAQRKLDHYADTKANPPVTANTGPANGAIDTTQGKLDKVGSSAPRPTLFANGDPASGVVDGVQRKLDATDRTRPNPILSATDLASGTVGNIQRLLGVVDATHPDPSISARDNASGTIGNIRAALSGLTDKSVTVTTNYVGLYSNKPAPAATGGPVIGPGTGTSDTAGIFALSNGEHILTAAEVAAAGGHAAIFGLRKALLAGQVQYAASGGPADRSVRPPVMVKGQPPAPVFTITAPTQDRSGPLLTIDQLITADPRAAMREAHVQLRDALAREGLTLSAVY